MSESAVARVYAEALFEAAAEAGEVERVRTQLGEFVDALAASPALQRALFDPQVDAAAKERVVAALSSGASPLLANVLRLLLVKGRLAVLGGVREQFERRAAQAARRIDVEVTSAVELGPELEKHIVGRVEGATGRTVRLTKRVDQGVVGGLVMRVGDTVVDASLRSRVEQLRKRMYVGDMRGGA